MKYSSNSCEYSQLFSLIYALDRVIKERRITDNLITKNYCKRRLELVAERAKNKIARIRKGNEEQKTSNKRN